jgi:hypothetical protein
VFPPVIDAPSVVFVGAIDQTIVWFVAFDGATVPVKVRAVPTVAVVGTPVIPVTGM